MLTKLKQKINKGRFESIAKTILSTCELKVKNGNLVITSMLGHRYIIMYLLAIKSLFRYIQKGNIIIIDDGTLTSQDKDLLHKHIRGVKLTDIIGIDTGSCPRGGTWERLFYIADLVKNSYVVQLDADTITLNDIVEVKTCIDENTSFILGTDHSLGKKSESLQNIYESSRHIKSEFIQILAEKNFNKLKNYPNLQYIRGSSGFTGFAKNSFSGKGIEKFSMEMQEILGRKKWCEWGSEQITTNFIIANSPKPKVLPYPKYSVYYPHHNCDYDSSVFLHFIGTHRFTNGYYTQKAASIIDYLKNKVAFSNYSWQEASVEKV